MNKRDAVLLVGRNRLFLIFCFFLIKQKEKHTAFYNPFVELILKALLIKQFLLNH